MQKENYLTVNKELIKKLGIVKAVILSELMDEENYYAEHDQLTEGGFFFSTAPTLAQKLSLSEETIRRYKKELTEEGYLETYLGPNSLPYCRTCTRKIIETIDRVREEEEIKKQEQKKEYLNSSYEADLEYLESLDE